MIDSAVGYLAAAVAVLLIFTPHEFAHAFIAYKSGDGTAKACGRLTLNPIKHLDPVGYVTCVLVGFGWAKPVPVNPSNFKNFRKGMFGTAIAGVTVNYIIAFLAYPLFLVILHFIDLPNAAFLNSHAAVRYIVDFFENIFYYVYAFGLSVVVFNLLPFYPLDGFRVVESLTRQVNPVQRFLKNYGYYILIILIIESFLCSLLVRYTSLHLARYFDILGYVRRFAIDILGFPIHGLWDLIIN